MLKAKKLNHFNQIFQKEEKMKRKMAVLAIIGLILMTGLGIAHAEKRTSGTVTSVHFGPGVFSQEPSIIVQFCDGRTKIFTYNELVHEIRINEFNVIYYEGNRITGVESALGSGRHLR